MAAVVRVDIVLLYVFAWRVVWWRRVLQWSEECMQVSRERENDTELEKKYAVSARDNCTQKRRNDPDMPVVLSLLTSPPNIQITPRTDLLIDQQRNDNKATAQEEAIQKGAIPQG